MTRRLSRDRFLAAVASVAALALFVTIIGCGGPKGGSQEFSDTEWVFAAVTSVTGAAQDGDPERWASLFVQGAAPSDAERARYATMNYGGDSEKVSVSGDTATATIALTNVADGSPVGEVEWEFAKEGDVWKIKSAPLP